jgi:peptidoglycan L-alanyl-D-glutamate endopeptidase CwlK
MLRQAGIRARISYGARSVGLQASMYANRRRGFRVAPPGQSAHNYGAAYDIAIYTRGGRYIGGGAHDYYQWAGALGRSLGLAWGGLWGSSESEVRLRWIFTLLLSWL